MDGWMDGWAGWMDARLNHSDQLGSTSQISARSVHNTHRGSGSPCAASAAVGDGCVPALSASAAASRRCTRMSG